MRLRATIANWRVLATVRFSLAPASHHSRALRRLRAPCLIPGCTNPRIDCVESLVRFCHHSLLINFHRSAVPAVHPAAALWTPGEALLHEALTIMAAERSSGAEMDRWEPGRAADWHEASLLRPHVSPAATSAAVADDHPTTITVPLLVAGGAGPLHVAAALWSHHYFATGSLQHGVSGAFVKGWGGSAPLELRPCVSSSYPTA